MKFNFKRDGAGIRELSDQMKSSNPNPTGSTPPSTNQYSAQAHHIIPVSGFTSSSGSQTPAQALAERSIRDGYGAINADFDINDPSNGVSPACASMSARVAA